MMKELAWTESGVAHVRKGRVYIYNCMINSASVCEPVWPSGKALGW